ncbi:MAG: hypothetical protein J0L84_03315, partial [Verrucomicrobia bacterium]|nr:hypothetical protein [Verrucomicrobiota bacterium]
ADTFSILSLGTRADADTWQAGAAGLGLQAGKIIKKPNPSLADLKAFFSRSDDWLFIAGHFTDHLYNHAKTIKIWFKKDSVVIEHPDGNATLARGGDFKQHVKAAVLFWGGCNVHSDVARVEAHRALFQKSTVMVGWLAITGWEIVDVNCGGKGSGTNKQTTNFFSLMAGSSTASLARTNWLSSADKIAWGQDSAGNAYRPRFSVVDETGQEWLLMGNVTTDKGQTKGRKFN